MDYGLRILLGGGALFWVPPIILLSLIIISLFKIFLKKDTEEVNLNAPLQKLNVRYAKGELDDKEYQNIKENLMK